MITISFSHMHDLTIVNIQYAKHANYMYFDIAYCVYDNYCMGSIEQTEN